MSARKRARERALLGNNVLHNAHSERLLLLSPRVPFSRLYPPSVLLNQRERGSERACNDNRDREGEGEMEGGKECGGAGLNRTTRLRNRMNGVCDQKEEQ